MDCDDKKKMQEFDECEGEQESAVFNNKTLFSCESTKSKIDINVNIQRGQHVTVGNNNTVFYEDKCPPTSRDVHEKTLNSLEKEARVKDSLNKKEKDTFSANSLLQNQENIFVADKGEPEKIRSPTNYTTRHPRRRKWKGSENRNLESGTLLSCSAIQVTNKNLEYFTDVRVPFLQVFLPGSDEETSFESRTRSCGNVTKDQHVINIEANIVQIGRDNNILTNQLKTRCSLKTERQEYRKQSRKTQNGVRRSGENAKFPKRVKKIDHIMEVLHKQRDSGEWEQFEETTSQLLAKNTHNTDFHISILLEQSTAANYRKDLKRAESLAQEALSIAPQASQPMVDVYRGRAYYCLSCVYKRTNELAKAFENIGLSEKYLNKTDSIRDKAFLAYEKGCVLQALALDCCADIPSRQNQLNEAKKSFKQCNRLCRQMYEEGEQTYLNKHLFAMMKIAMLLLDCRTKFGRSRQISAENVDKARKYLNGIENNEELWKRVAGSQIARVQFELAQSDYFFRKASYRKAEEHASYAASLAIDGGFNTEVEPAYERLADIQERMETPSVSSGNC